MDPLLAPLDAFAPADLAAWQAQVGEALESLRRQTQAGDRKPLLATGPSLEHSLIREPGWKVGAVAADDDQASAARDAGAEVIFAAEDAPALDLAPYHRAGASPVQELAFFVAALHPRASEAASLSVGFEVGRDLFEEIAKLRAARVLWQKTLLATGADLVPLPELRATTAWRTLTTREPMTNVLRATTQAYAAVLGGADTLVVRPHADTEKARRLAIQLQLVLRHEGHLDRSVDPLAGSYLVEARTDALARAAWGHARTILEAGGLEPAFAREECDASWEAWAARLRSGDAHVLGVSQHPLEGAQVVDLGDPGPSDLPARRDEEVFA
ncbi:MAG: methylmalonyl-CoA mutase family protein [Planctomycetota bacterium]|nr:methylmalonyl-CoA mutase family protein [Planctomycetota bacterium]